MSQITATDKKLTGSPNPNQTGGNLNIAGEGLTPGSLTIDLDNGRTGDDRKTHSIEVTVKADGTFSHDWTIPTGWPWVKINGGGAPEYTVVVDTTT